MFHPRDQACDDANVRTPTSTRTQDQCRRSAFDLARSAVSACLLSLRNACCRSVIAGASALRLAAHDVATSRSSPRSSNECGRERASHRAASSPSRVCSRIHSISWRAPRPADRGVASHPDQDQSGRIAAVAIAPGFRPHQQVYRRPAAAALTACAPGRPPRRSVRTSLPRARQQTSPYRLLE